LTASLEQKKQAKGLLQNPTSPKPLLCPSMSACVTHGPKPVGLPPSASGPASPPEPPEPPSPPLLLLLVLLPPNPPCPPLELLELAALLLLELAVLAPPLPSGAPPEPSVAPPPPARSEPWAQLAATQRAMNEESQSAAKLDLKVAFSWCE
jgi:hypothetical protein